MKIIGEEPPFRPGVAGRSEENARMKRVVIPIGGMTCQHCVASVTKALSGKPGVSEVSVNLARGEAMVSGESLDIPNLRAAVEELGFDAGEAV